MDRDGHRDGHRDGSRNGDRILDGAEDDALDRAISDAARALLARHGERFTMAQLEAAAGVSRATLYRRIGSKAKLLEHLAHARGESYEQADVRRTILRATRRVIARHGLAAATVELIADEAALGVATVYRHFGDKETLFRAFAEAMTPREAIRALALQPSDDVEADLAAIVNALLPFFHEYRDVFRLLLLGGEGERRFLARLRAHSDSSFARLVGFFEHQLRAGRLHTRGRPDDLARALVGLVASFTVIHAPHDVPPDDPRDDPNGAPHDDPHDDPHRTAPAGPPADIGAFVVELFLRGVGRGSRGGSR